jgi:hypothetical protein
MGCNKNSVCPLKRRLGWANMISKKHKQPEYLRNKINDNPQLKALSQLHS